MTKKKMESSDSQIEKRLSKETLLELKLSHLELEFLKKEIQILIGRVETIERDKMIFNLKISDFKHSQLRKEREHKELISSIGAKLGIDLKNATINQETGEINFI